jgi:hypothetical protein
MGLGMKTKDKMIKVVRQWYSNVADLQAKHKLVVFVRDNAGENKSRHQRFLRIRGSTKPFQFCS